ncbi:chloride channel protein, partial [Methanocaldococcus sp.]
SSLLLNLIIGHKINNLLFLPLTFFIVGVFIDKFNEIRRTGIDRVVMALKNNIELNFIYGALKIILTGLVISSGGSAGKEGPCVQSSAAFADYLYKKLRLKNRELVLLTGVAGGLGGAFLSPLGAAVFTCEIIERENFRYINLIPPIIASIVGYSIVYSIIGETHLININVSYVFNLLDLPLFILASFFCILVAKLFIKTYVKVKYFFESLPYPYSVRLTIAGILLAILGYFFPQVLGLGLDLIKETFFMSIPIYFLVILLLAKILATSLTIGSGAPGGLVIPSMCIGALSGLLFASIFNLNPSPYIVLGIATVVSATSNTPLGTSILCLDIFNSSFLIPATIGAVLGYQLTKFETLYKHLEF